MLMLWVSVTEKSAGDWEKVDIFVHTKMQRGDLSLISYTMNSDKQQGNAGY